MKKEIIFTLPAEALEGATEAVVLGDFNNWTPGQEFELKKHADGSFKTTVELEGGRTYQYRFLLNNGRWQNDYNAQDYVPVSGLFIDNCVITVDETLDIEQNQHFETVTNEEPSKPKVTKAKSVKTTAKAEGTTTKKPAAAKTVKSEKATKPAKTINKKISGDKKA
ncbi:MAG: isoamylase early set domain-containing protein [Ginsengibacter sp.]